jgi:nucleoside-diphosphate-sugar epimerase
MTTKKPVSLVTGACGFMGTHMVEILHEAGHHVRATDLASAYEQDDLKRGRFPGVLRKLGVEFTPSDMTKPESLKPLVKGVDYIFHIAAVFDYLAPWEVLYKVNVMGSRELFKMAIEEKGLKKLVLWGAGGVYGFSRPYREIYTEDMAPEPGNNYLKSKWQAEYDLMEMGRKHKLPFAIMRPTTVYGPRGVYGGGQMIMAAAKMKTAVTPASFTEHIPFVHVRDVCSAALHLAVTDSATGEIFNLNDDTIMTTLEFFQYVAEITGHKFVKLPPIPVKPLRPVVKGVATVMETVFKAIGTRPPLERDSASYFGHDFRYANDKLKKTGYKFIYADARDGLRDTIDWYKKEGWL